MPIDPRIALGYQAPQLESPVNMMMTAQKMQSGQQENALRQAQIENVRSEIDQRNALTPTKLAESAAGAKTKVTESQMAYHKQQRDLLALIDDPATYSVWRNNYVAAQPWADQILPPPEKFTPEIKQRLLLTADEATKQAVVERNVGNESFLSRVPTYGTGAATEVAGSRVTINKSPNAAQTTVNVAAPGKKFAETLGENAAKQLNDHLTQAQSAQSSLATSAQLAPLLNSKDFISGTLGDARLTVAKTLGLAGAEESQAYFAGIGQQVAERIKAFGAGTGLSDGDRDYAKLIAAGKTDITPSALKRIVRINDESARRVIDNYRERRTFLSKKEPTVLDYYPDIAVPQSGRGAAGGDAGASAAGGMPSADAIAAERARREAARKK